MLYELSYPTLASCGLWLDFERFESLSDGNHVPLTLTEFKILSILLRRDGCVVTRGQLLKEVAPNHNIIERNIDVHIQSIRRKLGIKGKLIRTVRGLGYRWDETLLDKCYA